MAKIPQPTPAEIINQRIEEGAIEEYPRWYIGYSELGGACAREIWYNFRWVKLRSTIPRMKRLFSRGDWEEERLEADLLRVGVEIFDKQREVVGLANHILGHIDGVLLGVPGMECDEILAEFKTANQKNFDKIKKDGVKKATPKYYSQAQAYMGKLTLNRCLFIVTNKNDEKRYMEMIKFDEDEYDKIEHRAFAILETDVPPARIGGPTWFECKFCNFHKICHKNAEILKSCRSCKNGTIEDEGKWTCGLDGRVLTLEDQRKGCDKYQLLEEIRK